MTLEYTASVPYLTNPNSADQWSEVFSRMAIYESFGLFVGNFDHSQVIRLKSDGGFPAHRIKECRSHFKAQCINCFHSSEDAGAPPPLMSFAATFGSTDDMAFAIVDDLSKVARLASAAPELESYTVAYPFRPEAFEAEQCRELVGVKDLLGYSSERNPEPLIAVTQIKLSGLLILGLGLNGQLASVSLIVARIRDLMTLLKSTPLRGNLDSPIFSTDDLNSLRFAVLDPISSDDILILWSAKNYSVIATALTAIRKLTFSDLWKSTRSSFTLASQLREDSCFLKNEFSAAMFFNSFDQKNCDEALDCTTRNIVTPRLNGNHICSTTVTTLGIMAELWERPREENPPTGFVSVRIVSDVSPGHEGQVSEWLIRQGKRLSEFKTEMPRDCTRMLRPGRHDLDHGIPEESANFVVVPMCRYVDYIYGLFAASGNGAAESGFQDISTYLSIPTPAYRRNRTGDEYDKVKALMELLQPEIDTENHVDIMSTIDTCARKLEESFSAMNEMSGFYPLKCLGFTASARGVIQRLFSDFITALRDPLHFESVLDLVDSFRHLNRMLVEVAEFVQTCRKREQRNLTGLARAALGAFSESLRLALITRIGRSSPKKEEPFGDVRGAISDLINVTDTAMKCSLGLLRRLTGNWDRREPLLSGILGAHINQRAEAIPWSLAEHNFIIVKADTSHVFRIENLARILHEVAHLYFECLFRKQTPELSSGKQQGRAVLRRLDRRAKNSLDVRLTELFSEAVVCSLIFGGDTETYVRYQLLLLKSVVIEEPEEKKPEETVLFLVEGFFRLFIVLLYANSRNSAPIPVSLDQEANRNGDSFGQSFAEFVSEWKEFWPDEIAPFNSNILCLARSYACGLHLQMSLYEDLVFRNVDVILNEARLENDYDRDTSRMIVERSILDGLPIPLHKPLAPVNEFGIVWQSVYAFIKVNFAKGRESYFDYVDATFDGLPKETREELFRTSCILTKSLWHISTRQRARRLLDLLQEPGASSSGRVCHF